jgi:hypothetical protein
MAADEHRVTERRFDLLTERVLGAVFEVSNTLGSGFLEKVYAQRLNYLRASGVTLCPLVNFQKPKVEWKRIVHGLEIPEP